jgi:hypothetical protein
MEKTKVDKKWKGKMKTTVVLRTRDSEKRDTLFLEGVEMAKTVVSDKLWYNLNLRRIRLVVSFCMDYLHCQKESIAGKKEGIYGHRTHHSYYN